MVLGLNGDSVIGNSIEKIRLKNWGKLDFQILQKLLMSAWEERVQKDLALLMNPSEVGHLLECADKQLTTSQCLCARAEPQAPWLYSGYSLRS